jgi:small conductance mechanosensitive channel
MNILTTTGLVSDLNAIQRYLVTLPEKAINLGLRLVFAVIVLCVGMQIIKVLRKLLKKTLKKSGRG